MRLQVSLSQVFSLKEEMTRENPGIITSGQNPTHVAWDGLWGERWGDKEKPKRLGMT